MDLYLLFHNSNEELHYSPYVDDQRPMKNIFHGTFAFLQDLHISARLLDQVDEIGGLSIRNYVKKTSERVAYAMRIISKKALLTKEGQQLLSGFDQALSDLQKMLS